MFVELILTPLYDVTRQCLIRYENKLCFRKIENKAIVDVKAIMLFFIQYFLFI